MDYQEQTPFSLVRYYRGSRLAGILDAGLAGILVVLVLYAPLPFGSVEYTPRAVLQGLAALCLLLWMVKLIYAGNPDELSAFRERHNRQVDELRQRPLFHRYALLARILRLISLGRWPKKNRAENLIQEGSHGDDEHPLRPFYSFFGYPVCNTGIEAIVIAFVFLLCLQLVPIPSAVAALISPSTRDLYSTAAQATGATARFFPLSLDPFATFTKILEYLAYFAIFLTVVNNVRTQTLYWLILYSIFIAAVFQGVYGLYEFLSGSHHIFGYVKRTGLDSASGTFVNRNHFAAYLELSLPLLIALIAGRVRHLRAFRGSLAARIAHALETEGSQILMLLFMIVLVAVALIFSLSRSGITFGLTALTVFLYIYRKARHELSRKTYLALGIFGTVGLAVWVGLNPVLQRFLHLSQNWSEGARLQVWTDTLKIFLHFPVAGTGAGTFPQIFPMYRSFLYNNIYREAHNDYIQLLAESGVLFFFLLIALASVLASRLKHVLSRDLRRLELIQLGAFCSLISLALHSLTDFSLQIPAIAVQGAVVAGLLFSHYHAKHHEHG
ncbi:MAG TPA: O-antigen ligase family protein [Acidobacteriota bacterium]|nr:O-antigen ligase family protein [Acidobacteriota bacterium]